MGWLRILSRWVGPEGAVTATDVDKGLLETADTLCADESLTNVHLLRDDFFATRLPPTSFNLVHLRFQLAPLGRALEQVATARQLAKAGSWIVLEDPETGTWRENPLAPSAARLRALIIEAFARAGGDLDAGRRLPEYLRAVGIEPEVRAHCVVLSPGHPYLQLPLQFAASLRPHLLNLVSVTELDRLMGAAKAELDAPDRWGTTFTLVQAWGRSP
jgi:hypothetical protein